MPSKKLNETAENREFSRLTSINKCPNCGGKLSKGYFTIPRGIGLFHSDTYDNAPALRCERCGIAILDYGVVTRAHTPGSFLKKCVKCDESIPIASEYCLKCGAYQKEKKEEP